MLGMIESHHVDAILLALAGNDGSALIDTVASMAERPVDYLSALDELLTVLHNVSLFQVLPEAVAAKQADSSLVRELASVLGKEDVQLYYQIGLLGKRDLPLAPDPASGFEMTLLRMLTFSPEGESGVGGDAAESRTKKSVSSSGAPSTGVAREVQKKKSASSKVTTSTPTPRAPSTIRRCRQRSSHVLLAFGSGRMGHLRGGQRLYWRYPGTRHEPVPRVL